MSFLDNLLTFENPLEEGRQLLTFPRTWRSYLPGNYTPFCYKAHQTKTGLHAILPHNQDGSIFLKFPKEDFSMASDFPLSKHAVGSFYLQTTFAKRERELILGSKLSRSSSYPVIRTGVNISVSYNLNADGIILSAHLDYELLLHHPHFKKVHFDIYRNLSTGKVSAEGPTVNTNITPFEGTLWLVDYDTTLLNLVNIILQEELGPEYFFPLLNFGYVEQHQLH